MPIPHGGEDTGPLVALIDVEHDDGPAGCRAALLVLNPQSEPVEFVFNNARPGCSRLRFGGLWGTGLASRTETRLLLRGLFDTCRSAPSALIVDEDIFDARLVALDLRAAIPCAFMRSGTPNVSRWIPTRPPDRALQAVRTLLERSPFEELRSRIRSGLNEALPPKDLG